MPESKITKRYCEKIQKRREIKAENKRHKEFPDYDLDQGFH